jgi:riboflavin transporter 2
LSSQSRAETCLATKRQHMNRAVLSTRVVIVYISVIIFALSSWISVNGFFSQLPIFVRVAPEGWAIASKMALALQMANIFPVTFLIIASFISRKHRLLFETISIYLICIVGTVCCILLGLFWDKQITIGGQLMSFWLLFFVFWNGAVDCTTSVIYFPFISNYQYVYTSALTVGEGLTGGIVGVIGFIQQPGSEQPRFSVLVFCIILAVIMALSALAFTFLRFSFVGKSQLRVTITEEQTSVNSMLHAPKWKLAYTYRLILSQMLISFFENGILVSTTPYVYLNYPDGSVLMSYAINTMMIASPICCFIAYFVPTKLSIEKPLHVVWLIGCVFQVVIAFMSPEVPHKRSLGMGIVIIIIAVLTKMTMAYCKTKEFLLAHERLQHIEEHSDEEHVGSFVIAGKEFSTFRLAGFGIQIGALVGSVIMYLLTSAHVFK